MCSPVCKVFNGLQMREDQCAGSNQRNDVEGASCLKWPQCDLDGQRARRVPEEGLVRQARRRVRGVQVEVHGTALVQPGLHVDLFLRALQLARTTR